MPYKQRRSPFWWTSYEDADGKRVRRSLGTSNRKEAEALEAKWRLEAYVAVAFDEQPDRNFDDLMLDYLTAVKDTKRSYDRDVRCVKQLRKVFGGKAMSEIGQGNSGIIKLNGRTMVLNQQRSTVNWHF